LYELAVAELADSAEKLKNHAVVQYHLGMAYYKKGQNALAKKQLQKALALDDNFDEAQQAYQLINEL
jgi:Tfp pilus assembly protein PilF